MHYENIGEMIHDLRKHSNMTQANLARGICTQAQISKLEKGKEYPSCITLYEISKKLGVDMNYFFETISTPRLDYVEDVMTMVREGIRSKNYEEVEQIVKHEKKTPLFEEGANKQFLLWNEGLCDYYNHSNADKAIQTLHEALHLTFDDTRVCNEREIEILNSLAVIYKNSGESAKAYETFDYALKQLNKIPKLKDFKIKIRVLYNCSKSCFSNEEYEESTHLCHQAIQICEKEETFYLFGELHYQQGRGFNRLNAYETALKHFQKAQTIFQITESNTYNQIVQTAIQKTQDALAE